MPAPHAVLLTLSDEGKRPVWSYRYTGTLPRLISFVSHSYENTGGVGVFFPFWNSPTRAFPRPSINLSEPVVSSFPSARSAFSMPGAFYYCPEQLSDPLVTLDSFFSSLFSNLQLSTLNVQLSPSPKSFSCNTYETPRKCCKQKTYVIAKPFRCNTYKKQGGYLLQAKYHSPPCLRLLSPGATIPFAVP